MLLVTGVDKGDIVPIIIYIVDGSRASAQKGTSNTEHTRFNNVKNLMQHTELNISLRKPCLLLAASGSISLQNTAIPSEAILHRKTAVSSKTNPLLASANLDLVRIKSKKDVEEENANTHIRHLYVNDAICRRPAALTVSNRHLAEISQVQT